MNNFNPSGYLTRLVRNIINNQIKPQTQINTAGTFANSLFTNTAKTPQKQTLSPELKMTPMEVEQTSKYVKELLNLPKDVTQVISQMVTNKTMTTAQNVQLLLLMSSGKIDLNQIALLLNDNTKVAMQKLVQTLSQAAKMGVTDTAQLKDLINTLGLISTTTTDTASALKNFILLYLPWLPLNAAGENLDFDIDVFDKSGEDSDDDLQSITILIQTMNFSNIKATLEMTQNGKIEILLNCIESFPRDKVLAILKKESENLNIQSGLVIETTKKEIPKDEVKRTRAEISASSCVSPQLMLMAHAVIKIVFKIDKDFSNLTFKK